MHCLVVDDDAQVRHSLARVIQAHGLATVEASSGTEALAILESQGEIPIVISDIYMPEMDGWEFIQEFQKIRDKLTKNVEIHIITSSNHPKDITRAKTFVEVKSYLQKPVTLEALQDVVSNYNMA